MWGAAVLGAVVAVILGAIVVVGALYHAIGRPSFSIPVSKYADEPPEQPLSQVLPSRDDPSRPKRTSAAGKTIAVMGGSGFVGSYVVEALIGRGDRDVLILDVAPPPEGLMAKFPFVKFRKCDVTSKESLRSALAGVKIVIHTIAAVLPCDHWDFQWSKSKNVNVDGMRNVTEVCVELGVETLVHTSTSNVSLQADKKSIVDGTEENPPLATTFYNWYTRSKVEAEKIALAADKSVGSAGVHLRVASARPCSAIYGWRDRFNYDFFVKRKMNVIMVRHRHDFLYVENLVHGLLLLEEALRKKPDVVGGEVFCISEDYPVLMRYFYKQCQRLVPDMEDVICPPDIVLFLLAIFSSFHSFIFRGTRSLGEIDFLSYGVYRIVSIDYNFKSDKARRVLGYRPVYSMIESLQLATERYNDWLVRKSEADAKIGSK